MLTSGVTECSPFLKAGKKENMIDKQLFPKDFLWGIATSAFQIEGGDLYDGKGIATTDILTKRSGMADTSVAADHYHHWKEDVVLMKELGIKVYRMGFSWSRIMPDDTLIPNEKGLSFYDNLINELIANDIQPFVTLYHFECPQALVDSFGGWKSRKMIDCYLAYAKICFEHFKGRVKMWATVNEQLIATSAGELNGNQEIDHKKNLKNIWQMSYHVSLAEHQAISLLRSIDPDAQVGPVGAIQVVYPYTSRSEDVQAAKHAEELMEFSLLDMSVRGKYSPYVDSYLKNHELFPTAELEDPDILQSSRPDFIGVNYYFSICAKHKEGQIDYNLPPFWQSDAYDICANPTLEKTEYMNMGVDPAGLRNGMEKIYDRYQLPMIITENGMAAKEELGPDRKIHDKYRIDYLKNHIEQVQIMLEEGLPVFGYCPWSFIDVISSHQGFSKRYGFVYVDRTEKDIKNCERVKKDSFDWYKQLISD
jgi:6-phospho-beta-glucosidase